MLHFAKEIVCVAVHGVLMILTFYAFCYNLEKEHNGRAVFYLALFLIECYAVHLHMTEAFGKERP